MADDGEHKFRAHVSCFVVRGAGVGGDDHLRDSGPIAQVEEDQVAEVAALVYPAHEHNVRAGVGGAQLTTHMSTFEIA